MKMNFTARQMKVYDSVIQTAEKKLAKFDKFFGDEAEMDITFSMPNGLEMVEITIRSQGMVFRAEEAAETFAKVSGKKLDICWGARPYRQREVMHPKCSGIKLPGWHPAVTLEEGIKKFLAEGDNE